MELKAGFEMVECNLGASDRLDLVEICGAHASRE
jgi:hypothetical protein